MTDTMTPTPEPQEKEGTMTGIDLIAAERQRQVSAEGWTPEHDDEHADGALRNAATAYLTNSPSCWPWSLSWWKPSDPVRNLVKAGALIAAEIDRLNQLARQREHTTR